MTSVSWIFNKFNKGKTDTSYSIGKYFIVSTFSQSDSNTISSELDNNTKIYLADSDGVLSIDGEKDFPNGLTKKQEPDSTTQGTLITMEKGDNKYAFSRPYGNWILHRKDKNNMFLLYNPLPRPESDAFIENKGTQEMKNIVLDSCTQNKGKDPVCVCLDGPEDNEKFCMDNLLTLQTRKDYQRLDNRSYGETEKVCGCANTKCIKTHPLNQKHFRKEGTINKCPDSINIAVCNTSISAGRDFKAGDVNVAQSCGQSSPAPPPAASAPDVSTPSAPASSPPPPSAPAAPQKPSLSTVSIPKTTPAAPVAKQPVSLPAKQPVAPVSKQPPAKPASNTKLYLIIGGIVFLLILILVLVFAFSGDDAPPAVAPAAPPAVAPAAPPAVAQFLKRRRY
jgi:hypothetical protein